MSDWSEIRNLAEKLKSVQTAESTHYLSERVCVDIVSHLINSGRLRLIRTIDGRAFLTENELIKEIFDELAAHRGRISLLELSEILECLLVAGELMTKSYIRRIAEEIQDRLEFRGTMSLTELARIYNFTPQFLTSIIGEYNGVLFNVDRDGDKLYTHLFMAKQTSKILGHLSAAVTPISLADCGSKLDIPLKVLSKLVDTVISSGRLKGTLTAGRSIYTPLCYLKAQDAFVSDFVKQNGYVEWTIVQRIGITDPSSYLRSHFPSAVHNKGFTICESTVSQIRAVLEDRVLDTPWIDVSHYLPAVFGAHEREWLIKPLLTKSDFVPIHDYMYLYSANSLSEHISCFDDFIREQAAVAAIEQRHKACSKPIKSVLAASEEGPARGLEKKRKSGGFGGRSREIKTKHVKKKYLKRSIDSDEEDDQVEICIESYIPRERLLLLLIPSVGVDAPEDLIEGVLDKLLPNVHEKFLSLVKSVYLQTSDSSKSRDRCLAEKDSLISTILSIQLFERGSLLVDDPDLRSQLLRQLIRGEVSTFVNRLYVLLAQNYEVDWPTVAVENSSSGKSRKNKQKKHDGEEVALKRSIELNPSDITFQQRDVLAELLNKMGDGPTKEASLLTRRINARLRVNTDFSVFGGSLSLDEIFSLCDDLAHSHLGINLSVSVLRSGAAKRKRQDRLLALDIAGKNGQQMIDAAKSEEGNYLACVSLAAAALFGQCLVGWPLPAHGKLVPHLSAWITKMLSSPANTSLPYAAAANELRAAKAGEQLTRLTELVVQEARHVGDVSVVSKSEKKDLVDQLLSTASRCLRAMESNSRKSSTD
ncbi:E3 UFM1-protein ligase 1 [Taenia crassiceps]|uniref:E3 UFM1-protein ligase 1 n=1 Tax=Taenia crassiceps TaxID=6207 RepID=A0ABR4QQT0_9CEST